MIQVSRHQWLLPADVGVIRAARLCRIVAAFALLLIAVTWRLWTPQNVFPQVPLLAVGNVIPVALAWCALAVAVMSLLVVIAFASTPSRLLSAALVTFAGAMVVLIVIDQHRLQPWAYQFVILAVLFATLERRGAIGWARVFSISIYAYSAVSKLDVTFADVLGRTFLDQLLSFVGASSDTWPTAARRVVALGFPLGEMTVAVMLSTARLRHAGVLLAVTMHVLLILILGPLGLDHWPGVLIWNCFFIAFIPVLFADNSTRPASIHVAATRWRWRLAGPTTPPTGDDAVDDNVPPARAIAVAAMFVQWMMVAVVLLPLVESIGWWDHWLSWGLYASRNEQVQVFLAPGVRKRLPGDLARHVPATDADWEQLRIDRWSLEALGAPIYPQARYQLGVAEAVAQQLGLDRQIRVVHRSKAARLTGERIDTELGGRFEIQREAENYWLNAHPRTDSAMID